MTMGSSMPEVLRTLATNGWCSRRRQPVSAEQVAGELTAKLPLKAKSAASIAEAEEKCPSDSEESTGTGTTSCDPRTDRSLRSSDDSADGSDMSDMEMFELAANEEKPKLPFPPGFKPPPGLEGAFFSDTGVPPQAIAAPMIAAPVTGLSSNAAPFEPTALTTRLSSNAAPFVSQFSTPQGLPSPAGLACDPKFIGATQHLQHTLVQLRGALAEWEAIMPASKSQELGASVAATAGIAIGAASVAMGAVGCQPQPTHTRMTSKAPIFQPSSSSDAFQSPQSELQPVQVSIADCLSQEKESLSTNLRELDKMDAARILIVRRINRLGLESPTWLRAHFSQYGIVDKVLVAHSRGKPTNTGTARVRTAGIGFIVMSKAEDVQAILSTGAEQAVNGVMISVQPYEVREDGATGEDTASNGDMRFQ